MTDKKGMILNIQRMSTEDGPGIRTTVFFKGCPLLCPWCHNPESIRPMKEIEWIKVRCIGCRTCIETCKRNALEMTEEGIKIHRDKCTVCLSCVEACPGLALEVKGIEWGVLELYQELIKDKAYFQKQGGVTLSGGEVLLQADFVKELLILLNQNGIHTAIDTCGFISRKAIDKVYEETDLFLYDVKIMDEKKHEEIIGQKNTLILDNLKYIADKIKEDKNKAIWIRTPVIPGSTDSIDNIKAIAVFLKENMEEQLERWELCAFNNLCEDKYMRLDRVWEYKGEKQIEKEHMETLRKAAVEAGLSEEKVFCTGTTRL
ncbi:MAG: glycyl-radical enzyme activating protein [Clostridia bacterium]|nr:glycyl-radical enzyme activating protein [Clostridia bacterium]